MESFLIFIKHHFNFLWKIIELVNGFLFHLIYNQRIVKIFPMVLKEFPSPPFTYRRLKLLDTKSLFDLIAQQNPKDLKYFNPHRFDTVSISKQFRNPSFLMMGAFDGTKLIGYFFLRFFVNKRCFVGRLIDKNYRGKEIGIIMNKIMYETAWRLGFHCLSTISRDNKAIVRAHSKNPTMVVLKELNNNYLLVEFMRGRNERV